MEGSNGYAIVYLVLHRFHLQNLGKRLPQVRAERVALLTA